MAYFLATVKINVDFSDRAQLERARQELEAAIEVIAFALSKLPPSEVKLKDVPVLEVDFGDAPQVSEQSLAAKIQAALVAMGNTFKSSDVYNNLPDVPRSAIKDTFRKMVEANKLKIIEQGQGTRPTVYQKTLNIYL